MDDFIIDLIFYFFAIFLAIQAIIWFLTVALPFLLIYIIPPGAFCYFLVRKFIKQMKTYRFSEKSWLCLVLTGFFSLFVSVALVHSHGLNDLWNIPVSSGIFLGTAICILEIWATSKTRAMKETVDKIEAEVGHRHSLIEDNNKKIKRLDKEILDIENNLKDSLELKKELDGQIRRLCSKDARIYSIKRREWQQRISRLDDVQLVRKKREYGKMMNSGNESDAYRTGYAIRYALAADEEIKRQLHKPHKLLKEKKARLKELQRKNASLQREMDYFQERLTENRNRYEQLVSGGVLLD